MKLADDYSDVRPTPRPGSSRYKVLPSIGGKAQNSPSRSSQHHDVMHSASSQAVALSDNCREDKETAKKSKLTDSTAGPMAVQSKSKAASKAQSMQLTSEPGDDEDRILLAIKLPSGERLQRYFRPSEKLEMLLLFAESKTESGFASASEFVCADSRRVLSDLKSTIRSADIADRSVLFLQLPESP